MSVRNVRVHHLEVLDGDGRRERRSTLLCPKQRRLVTVDTCGPCVDRLSTESTVRVVVCRLGDDEPLEPTAPGPEMPVAEMMTQDVLGVLESVSEAQVRRLMRERRISAVPVFAETDDPARRFVPIGLLSKSDLIEAGPATADAPRVAGDLMSHLPRCLPADAAVWEAAVVMTYEHMHRVLITGPQGELIGLVSALDVVRWLADENGWMPKKVAASS